MRGALFSFATLLAAPLFAQNADSMTPATRADEIETQRRDKAQHLEPDVPNRIEQVLQFVKQRRLIERTTAGVGGVHVRMGGFAPGNGFSAGPEYFRDLLHDTAMFRASVRGSTNLSYLMDAELRIPQLARGRAFMNLYAAHENFARVDYYGQGPNSARTGRSTYRREDNTFQVQAGVRPRRHFNVGVAGEYLMMNIGPGSDDRFASADATFTEATTPGIQQQTDFLRGSAFLQIDWRDNPGGPRSGGNYAAQIGKYWDQKAGRYSFNRLDLEVQQYFPFFNQRRVIAVRGRAIATEAHAGNAVPFYLQPTLGGPNDLRGFRRFRFYDNNSLVFNAEYRWEVTSAMDMALFFDTGRVFRRWEDFNLKDMEESAGFGFRFNIRNDVFLRIDTGFSREGFAVWFRFGNVF